MEERIGLELFNLGLERRLFSKGGFTTSVGRVAERLYRSLLFSSPNNWRFDILSAGKWKHRPDEKLAYQQHDSTYQQLFKPPAIPLINARVQSMWQELGHPRFYIPKIKRENYSLLQFTSEMPFGESPLAPIECYIAHDFYQAYVDPKGWESTRKKFDQHRDSLWVTAVSEYTRQDAIRLLGLAPERVRTIHNAVDHAVYQPEPTQDDEKFLAKWSLPLEYVLYVGSVALRKNIVTLIQALERHNEHSAEPLPLIIAGNVPGANYLVRRQVWNKIREYARITPVRQIQHPTDLEMACFYRHATMVVHPSTFEGFGLTVTEAMACGVPVICGYHTSLIEVGGNAARFTKHSKDVDELAAAIDELASSPERRAELKRLGLIQAAKFRWEFFTRDTILFYQDALNSIT